MLFKRVWSIRASVVKFGENLSTENRTTEFPHITLGQWNMDCSGTFINVNYSFINVKI